MNKERAALAGERKRSCLDRLTRGQAGMVLSLESSARRYKGHAAEISWDPGMPPAWASVLTSQELSIL